MEPRSTAAVAEEDALLLPRALFGLCFCLGLMGVLVLDRFLFFFLVPNEVPRLKIVLGVAVTATIPIKFVL